MRTICDHTKIDWCEMWLDFVVGNNQICTYRNTIIVIDLTIHIFMEKSLTLQLGIQNCLHFCNRSSVDALFRTTATSFLVRWFLSLHVKFLPFTFYYSKVIVLFVKKLKKSGYMMQWILNWSDFTGFFK